MQTERPHPGQLWSYVNIRVVIVAVCPSTVTYEHLAGGKGSTRTSLDDFLAVFRKIKG